jgi:hypothetical protein
MLNSRDFAWFGKFKHLKRDTNPSRVNMIAYLMMKKNSYSDNNLVSKKHGAKLQLILKNHMLYG